MVLPNMYVSSLTTPCALAVNKPDLKLEVIPRVSREGVQWLCGSSSSKKPLLSGKGRW